MTDKPLLDMGDAQWAIVKGILQKHLPDREVWAFGSRAKWTAKEFSDLDLAVIGQAPLPLEVSAALADDFSDSDLPWKVDVVDWASTSESFQKIIAQDKVVVQKPQKKQVAEGSGSSEWENFALGELGSFKYGKFLAKSQLNDSGFPVFSGYGVVGFLPSYQFEEPQLLIVCRGEGGAGDVKISPPECSITNLSIVVSVNEEVVSKKFLYWALKASDTHRLRTGSAQAQIVIGSLEKLKVTIPTSKSKQDEIATILTSLDDRITLLRETNATLEAIAALFPDAIVASLIPRIEANQLQAETLANLRDTLLPRLISGQLRIADAEAINHLNPSILHDK